MILSGRSDVQSQASGNSSRSNIACLGMWVHFDWRAWNSFGENTCVYALPIISYLVFMKENNSLWSTYNWCDPISLNNLKGIFHKIFSVGKIIDICMRWIYQMNGVDPDRLCYLEVAWGSSSQQFTITMNIHARVFIHRTLTLCPQPPWQLLFPMCTGHSVRNFSSCKQH